jgi:hypothetical protein
MIRGRLRRRQDFDPESLTGIPPRPASPGPRQVVFDSGAIQVIHGETLEAGPGDEILVVEEAVDLPAFATEATVFLNGWSLEYLNGDQHVNIFGTVIENSRVRDGQLRWRATGILWDDGRDDPFEWHYFYTVVAWNGDFVRCGADHNDLVHLARSHLSTRLPIVASSASVDFGGLNPPNSSVVLPRGFVYWFSDLYDHHLLHVGYNLTQIAGARVEHAQDSDGDSGTVGNGVTTWDTHGIMQDNEYRRFHFWHYDSTVSGPGVRAVQPSFSILPTRRELNIGSPPASGGHKTRELEIQDVPFDCAVPVLAGWDIRYDFDDEHVRKMGVWLDEVTYDPPSGPAGEGKLGYRVTSALYDNDKDPSFTSNFNTHILGFTESQISEPT